MDELLALIRAVVEAFRQSQTGDSPTRDPRARQPSAARTLRDLLSERVMPPGKPNGSGAPAGAQRTNGSQPATANRMPLVPPARSGLQAGLTQPSAGAQPAPVAIAAPPGSLPQSRPVSATPSKAAPMPGSPLSGAAAPRSAASVSGAARAAAAPIDAAAREAGLVRGLFSSPQSLVAAFIAAEVLAPPVALRSAGTAWRGSAL